MHESLAPFVVCARCGSALARELAAFSCPACGARYADLGTLPCLVRDPDRARATWRSQLAAVHAEARATLGTLEAERRKPALLSSTVARLDAQMELARALVAEIDAIVVVAIGPPADRPERVPSFQPLRSMHLALRDWGWPDTDENARALALVERVIAGPLGRTLVVGAGACRLAYDLHRSHASSTVAIDIDPFILLLAEKVLSGAEVPLTEAYVDAPELGRLCAARTLRAPERPREGLCLLVADALAPPLANASFDTVITPWFTDVVPPDLRDFFGVMTRVLAPGGRWIFFGPLLYPVERAGACRFVREELLELAALAGFTLEIESAEALPFATSPLTERGRTERCFAFSMTLRSEPGARAWLVLPYLPVPDFDGRESFAHESAAFTAIVSLVDGRRSIDAIAAALVARTGASPVGVKDTVRYCLSLVHPACAGPTAT
jgi:SAM-dependent methyltransferase